MTDAKLRSVFDRIGRLEERQSSVLAEKRAVYTEAKNAGYNTKALRRIIAQQRQKDWEQTAADMHAYQIALGMAVNDVANGASLRAAAAKHGIAKSTIHDAVRREEKSETGQPAEDGLEIPGFLRRGATDPPNT